MGAVRQNAVFVDADRVLPEMTSTRPGPSPAVITSTATRAKAGVFSRAVR